MSTTLIVIPTYNEKENVRQIASAIHEVVSDVDILFVDDNSPDGSGSILDKMSSADQRIHVIHRSDKQGLGRAYIAGFKWALERDFEFIFEMDADFSHDPAALPAFLEAAENADLVLGTRYRDGVRVINWPLARLILSKSAGVYVRAITGMPFTDPTGGFKCFRRPVLESINLDSVTSNGYSFQIELSHYAWIYGFRVAEVNITFEDRRAGQSKMNNDIVREALWTVWRLLLRYRCRRSPRIPVNPGSVIAKDL